MKRIVVLTVAAALILGAAPLFAGGKACPSKASDKEKSLFEIVADTIKPGQVRERNKIRPLDAPTCFQDVSEGIKEGSAKAKQMSLRGPKTK